jgi:PAS domain S-box-containing protein
MNSTDHLSELESLRSQVADLTRVLAERDVSMRDLREQSNLLRTIIEGTAAETGDEFFASLVTHLTATLHVQYAVIGEVCEGRLKKIRTLAVATGGTLVDNFEYELAHTPCATTLTQGFACFDRDLQATFPQFQRLADLGAESYCAVPLRTKGGTVIGLLVVMDTKPLRHGDDLQSLLRLLAPRVVVELERRRAELERVQALADLRNVMETVPDVMFTLDTQGNLVKWNRRLGDVTGYSPEELLNKPALAFVPLEEQTRTAAAIQRAFTEGYAELDGQMLTKDLRTIPYHWTGALLKNAQGEPIGITGVGRDVSEKKQAEEELTQQRRHLVDAQALAHLGSWGWDIDTGEVQWSDELFRIFGHEPGSIHVTYDTFLAALLPDDHDRVLAGINAAQTGKMAYDIEYRIVRPNSEVRSIHARGDVYRDATGHPLSMAGTVLDITERKRIEDALRASEERWHLAVRGSNDGIWDWNIQTGDVFFSSRWKAMRGFEDHEIRNDVDEWRSRIHPDDLDRVLQSIDAYLAKHTQEFCEEYRVQRKDGSCLWILDRGVALWADDGTPLRMAGSETDITARKGAEEALRASEERYRSLYDDTPTMYFTLATNGTVLSVNRFGADQLGYPVEELVGKSVFGIFHKDDQAVAAACLSGCLTTPEKTGNWEFRKVRKDGCIIWVREMARVGQSSTGATVVLVTCEDITERKQAGILLRQGEERYRSLVDNAPIGIFLNEGGRFAYVNREMQRILHATSAEQLIGTQVLDRIAPEFHNVVKDRTRVLMDHQQSVPSLDEQYVRLDGSRVDVAVTAIPASVAGTPMMQVLVLDIGERKHMEDALRQREGDLRAAIEERERISQDLHDGILQSLFAVGLTLEASKSMMSPGNRKTAGPPVDQAIGQLNSVMREIRNFIAGLGSDLLRGKDLQSALQHMLDSLTQNQATRVRLAVEDRAAQAVSVEQSLHLLLVIQEAVSNCIRHGRAQEATVSLKMLKQGIRLSVRDNGRGFNPEAATGTGHGLANMAVRARKIGGRFTVMSKVNEGTRIVLDLPKEASDVLR